MALNKPPETAFSQARPSIWGGSAWRLVLPSVLTIVLFTAALLVIILPALRENIMDRKREMIRELTRAAWDTLDFYYQQEQSGKLTRKQAQMRARAQLRRMRYGADHKDYFWINDMGPRMIMHPYRPELEGTDVSDFKDPTGKRLFSDMVRVVKHDGWGYVDYMWQWKDDPRRIVPKVSFVKEFKPWGWIVGTGIYVEDVTHEISAMTSRLTYAALAILGIIAVLEFYMITQNLKSESRRRMAERELRESQAMLELVMDNIPQLIYWKDITGRYLGCNQAFADQAGLSRQEHVSGKTDSDLPWTPSSQGRSLAKERRVMEAGAADLHVVEAQRGPDGSSWWADANRIPLKDGWGRVVGVLCTYEDITGRVEMDQALKESERRFRTLVENSLGGIFIVQDGRVVYMNPEQRRLFGRGGEPFAFDEINGGPPAEWRRLDLFSREEGNGQGATLDLELHLSPAGGGQLSWVHCRARRITYQGREACLVIMLDTTKARELEHLVRVQDKMASLGRVAAGIAHEIRNPLSGINMYLSAMKARAGKGGLPMEFSDILDKTSAASRKIEGVIKRVLDFSRPSAPKLSWVNINQVVSSVLELSSVTMRKSGITLKTNLGQSLPPCHADSQLLEQVLLNLVTNAVQALERENGPKLIGITSHMEQGRLVVEVDDSGPGVAPDIIDRIFDPFFTEKKEGSGIGLSLSHRIVSDHGGRLTVSTSNWGGARFTMELPAELYWGYDSHG